MKANILKSSIIAVGLVLACATNADSVPLYKLPPFKEALEKSKAGEGEGFFALALHYAKGDEVKCKEEYCQPMIEKAASLGFKIAILVKVMRDEPYFAAHDDMYWRLRKAGCESPDTESYLGASYRYPWVSKYSITNENDVATICAEYERLYSLGVEVATNELARFKKNVAAVKQVYEEIRLKEENKKSNAARAEEELRGFLQEARSSQEEAMRRERERLEAEMRREQEERERTESKPLEPLIPFEEALAKAQAGEGAGYYALAMHYGKGDAIPQDIGKMTKFLELAAEKDYPDAVYVDTLFKDSTSSAIAWSSYMGLRSIIRTWCEPFDSPGVTEKIRKGYEKAMSLGVVAASNELARFNAKVDSVNKYTKQANDILNDVGQPKKKTSLLSRSHKSSVKTEKSEPLYTLPPFNEALEKANAGEAEGYFALALHYSLGEEVERDRNACQPLVEKAADLGYGLAALIKAMKDEEEASRSSGAAKCVTPNINKYLDENYPSKKILYRGKYSLSWKNKYCVTNENDIAIICAEYEKAFSLGMEGATNELARFKKNVELVKNYITEKQKQLELKKANTAGAKSVLADVIPASAESSPFDKKAWRNMAYQAEAEAEDFFKDKFVVDKPWKQGKGVCYYEKKDPQSTGDEYRKYDPEGRLVEVAEAKNFKDLVDLEAKKDELLKLKRTQYAESIGMTYEEAEKLAGSGRFRDLRSR